MAAQTVTLHLPEAVMRRARVAAKVLQHPVEEVLAAALAATLPDVENVPQDMQDELARMTWLSDQALWDIAHTTMSHEHQQQLLRLTELQDHRPLTTQEQETLETLRQEYGRITLRKARAYALLSLRGGKLLLADN
jgi:hypothetical protein